MSYNIDHVEYLGKKILSIKAQDALDFCNQHGNDYLPEICFLTDVEFADFDPNEIVPIDYPGWSGEGSGGTIELFEEALSLTTGCAELLLTWEGGDSVTGYKVTNGSVKKKKVRVTLE